jgi:2-keto-4-pentenoate hydratase
MPASKEGKRMDDSSLIDELYAARKDGRALSIPGGQFDYQKALELQLAVADRFIAAGDEIGGWKIGLTSASSRDLMGDGVRPFGYVLGSRILRSDAEIPLKKVFRCAIEPELCLIMGSALHGKVDSREAKSAVRSVAAAFEINELRVGGHEADRTALVADGLVNWGIVVGSEIPVEEFDDGISGVSVELTRDGAIVARAKAGDDLEIDDPFLSLSRLSTLLDEHGCGLEAGQPVITGKFAGPLPVAGSGSWKATFSRIGEVSVRFS